MSTKIIIDNTDYDIYPQENGDLLLKPKIIKINDMDRLKEYDFCNSTIISCKINNDILNKNKYKQILNDIYNNPNRYPYLVQVYDSVEDKLSYHVKIYQVDYDKFEQINK